MLVYSPPPLFRGLILSLFFAATFLIPPEFAALFGSLFFVDDTKFALIMQKRGRNVPFLQFYHTKGHNLIQKRAIL